MRTLAAGLLAGFVLLPAVPAWGQTLPIQKQVGKKLKEARKREKEKAQVKLEDLVAEALKTNPDLRVAEAKVRTAEAERDQLRLKLVQEVTVANAELQRAHDTVPAAKAQLDAAFKHFGSGLGNQKEITDAAAVLQKAKADLAAAEAKLAYLVGKRPAADSSSNSELRRYDARLTAVQALATLAAPKVERTMAEKLRMALDVPFYQKAAGKRLVLRDVLNLLRKKLVGINVVESAVLEDDQTVGRFRVSEPVPLGAVLQLIEEEYGCRFIVRDYGIRVVSAQEAVPPGAVFVVDFWKQHQGGEQHKK
jgi:hypothetical protein